MTVKPPRLPLRLLEELLPEDSRDAIIGDLVEIFEHDVASRPFRARLRFWREALAAVVSLQTAPASVSAYHPATRESLVQSFLADLRHSVRVLRRAPLFTLLCAGTLGVAIGATTAIFSIVDPILLRPLPYPGADRIVALYERSLDGSASRVGYETFRDLAARVSALRHAAVFGDWQPTLFGESDAERLQGQRVSWEYFRVLGVRPVIGRDFEERDDTPATRNHVILSHSLWTRRFAADPAILGRSIDLGGISHTVIGVMPRGFDNVMQPEAQLWRVLGYAQSDPWACRTCRHLQMIGRIHDGISSPVLASQMEAAAQRLFEEHATSYVGKGAFAVVLQEQVTKNARPILLVIVGAATLVLLIAAANVVNLQLARAVRREEEFAVRAALGAGRGRIARQLVTEGMLIAALATAVGVTIAAVTLPVIVGRLPADLPRVSAIALDWRVLGVVAVAATLVGLMIGLLPAIGVGRSRLFGALRGARTLGGTRHRARATLVVAEVSLALMLVIGAGLLGRSLARLLSVDAGFDTSNLITMQVQATGTRYEDEASVFANHDRIREAVRALPGVQDVGLTTQLPLTGNLDSYGIAARDKPLANPQLAPDGDRYTVSWDFMRAMRIPIIRGRGFTEAEANDSAVKVVIVSSSLAERIWPGEDAIGKFIRLGGPTRPWREVVGIAADIRHSGLDATVSQQFYVPERQWFGAESQMVLVVRTATDPASMIGAVREAVRSADPLQPISRVATMDQVIARSTSQRRLGLMLFLAFSAMAIVLAAAGIYGVLAGAVSERAREIGLRSALGATPRQIASMVLAQGMRLAALGLVVGVSGALALSRYLRSLLYGVGAQDPAAVGAAIAVIGLVVLAACIVPARRALAVDPLTALRSD